LSEGAIMSYKKLENILLYFLLSLTAVIYLYTVAPTLSFWDCGEFISSAYTLAVPHPPGTPLYILMGRVWLMVVGLLAGVLPISKEVAWHMNLLGLGITVATVFLIYRMLLKIFRMWKENNNQLSYIIITFGTSLAIAFYYTIWENAVETEVYAAATFVFLLVNYLILLWYDSVKQGKPQHRYLLLSFYSIFLATGIHLTPFLIFFPVFAFVFYVERRYIRDTMLWLLGIFQVVFFMLVFLLPKTMYTPAIVILAFILGAGILLPFMDKLRYRNWRFFWAGIFLLLVGFSTELYLPIRSRLLDRLYKQESVAERYYAGENIAPRINECDPGENFAAFDSALHRSQYGPAKLIPRQTQEQTGFGVLEGYFWQLALFVRYLSWQPLPEFSNNILRSVVLALFYVFGIWGMVELFRRERKLFFLTALIMFMLSFAMVGYLNLKFSPSDSNPKHQAQEVRERDYFFHTGHAYFGMLVGIGFFGFLMSMKRGVKNKRLVDIAGLSGYLVFSVVPLFANFKVNSRFGDFIPKDYAYNMLISCDDGGILFTNGDNDTFPLWFAQEVLGLKRRVVNANLSLINTQWYIRQLKDWGVPISFSERVINRLEPFMTRDRRVVWVKDIMIRNIIATNAGIALKEDDYVISQQEFAERHLKNYRGKLPVYFASTVSAENFEGFRPYLRLEGLVYRVVGDSTDPNFSVDIEKTKNFFYRTYRYTGIFDPEQQKFVSRILDDFDRRKKEGEFYDFGLFKDDNTRRLYTNYAAGLASLGIALREKDDLQGTLDAWRFALLFDPFQNVYFSYNLGVLFAQMDMRDSAYHYLSQIDTRDPTMMVRIGSVFANTGYYDLAIEYFQRAIGINPRYSEAYSSLVMTYLAMGDKNSAMNVLEDWLVVNPKDANARNMLQELRNK
jgi:tetratricopeptide (TPR) repeat protein